MLSKINPKGRLELITIPGGSHNDLVDSEKYKNSLGKKL